MRHTEEVDGVASLTVTIQCRAETSGAETLGPKCPIAEKSQRRNGQGGDGDAQMVAPKRRRPNGGAEMSRTSLLTEVDNHFFSLKKYKITKLLLVFNSSISYTDVVVLHNNQTFEQKVHISTLQIYYHAQCLTLQVKDVCPTLADFLAAMTCLSTALSQLVYRQFLH